MCNAIFRLRLKLKAKTCNKAESRKAFLQTRHQIEHGKNSAVNSNCAITDGRQAKGSNKTLKADDGRWPPLQTWHQIEHGKN